MARKKTDEQDDAVETEADVQAEADESELDETIPGGMYEVNGRLVNAEGQPITKTGKVKE